MFFQTYPNDVSLDIDNSPSYYIVSIEYYDDDHDINYDFIECDDMFGVVCLLDKLDPNDYITTIGCDPIWDYIPIDMDQCPSKWTDC